LASQQLLPSRQEVADAQWGNGQYFTDISPLDAKSGSAHQLSRALFTLPWYHRRVKNWLRIDVSSLDIKKVTSVFSRTYGDRSIYSGTQVRVYAVIAATAGELAAGATALQ
jgi:hypothetical protein